jgi:hypothetical protein
MLKFKCQFGKAMVASCLTKYQSTETPQLMMVFCQPIIAENAFNTPDLPNVIA